MTGLAAKASGNQVLQALRSSWRHLVVQFTHETLPVWLGWVGVTEYCGIAVFPQECLAWWVLQTWTQTECVLDDTALPVMLKRCPCYLASKFINGAKHKIATNYFRKYLQDAKCLEIFVQAEANTESKIMEIKRFLAHSRLMMSGLITAVNTQINKIDQASIMWVFAWLSGFLGVINDWLFKTCF